MGPLFNPGDSIVIDSSVKSVEFDLVCFFRPGSEGVIKCLWCVLENGPMCSQSF